MPLFNLTDIKIDNTPDGFVSNRLVGSSYDYNTFKYPIDLGTFDKAHYIVIHINEQVKTQFSSTSAADLPTVTENQLKFGSKTGLENVTGVVKGVASFLEKKLEQDQSLILNEQKGVRTIRRTTDTIALYMPDTLNFTYNQQYTSASLQGAVANISAGKDLVDKIMAKEYGEAAENLMAFLGQKGLNTFLGESAAAAVLQNLAGLAVNPQLELVYSSPDFRQFRFDFVFYPRSTQEAREVQRIITRLRFHQAPEVKQDFGAYFLIPPSEFDIKFYYNGRENKNIPKISTCVLTSIDTDYAPNGWASYERPGEFDPSLGGTGMPVSIRLSLNFQEIEFMTKSNFYDATPKADDIRDITTGGI